MSRVNCRTPEEHPSLGSDIELTARPSPRIIARYPALATAAGSALLPALTLVSVIRARSKKFVFVTCIRDARHQTGQAHAGVLELIPQGIAKRIDECFAGVVDRLIGARRESSNRSRHQDAALTSCHHALGDPVDQIDRPGD